MEQNTISEVTAEDIEQALQQERFTVVYQPQVSLSVENKLVGVEAFVRLEHPSYGLLAPALFLEQVREQGKMLEMTKCVLSEVAKDWQYWHQLGYDLNVSVIIDNAILDEEKAARELGEILSGHKIPRHRLTLGFSSGLADIVSNQDLGKRLLALRLKGYDLAMSCLQLSSHREDQLDMLPMDELKIDRMSLQNVHEREDAQAAVRQAMQFANRYSLRIVAVGVETDAEQQWLQRVGVERGQGYLFGRPMDKDSFTEQFLGQGKAHYEAASRLRVLIVEDDEQYQNLLLESLGEQYQTLIASSLVEAESLLETETPDIMLVDVELPDGSGIEFCKTLNESKRLVDTSVLFISGLQEMQVKMDAYQVGAIDFIAKPFSIIEFIAKIKQVANFQLRRSELIDNKREAHDMAMQSLKDASHYGDIVQFFKNLMVCRDEQDIARELFSIMDKQGLHSCVEFRGTRSTTHLDQVNGVCSPMQINVFELLRDKGRLYEFGPRLIVNDRHVSYLVTNLPEDDQELGKVRDYVAVIIEGMEARYRDILRQRVINTVSQQLQIVAQKLMTLVESNEKDKVSVIEKCSFDLQMSFHVLDLTDEQEKHITGIIDRMMGSRDESEQQTSLISEEVNEILTSMSRALEELEVEEKQETETVAGDSVELF